MGNPPLVHYEGAVYHVTARGARQGGLFLDDQDRMVFLNIADRAKRRFRFKLLAFCLMSNHLHLLIQVSSIPLDAIMGMIMKRYADYFNSRYGYKGCAFDKRYGRRLVRNDRYLAIVIRYIHGNPVKAGMAETACDWPWSSAWQFRENAKGLADLDAVRALFDDDDLPMDLFEPAFDLPLEAYVPDKLAAISDEPQSPRDLGSLADRLLAGSGYTIDDLCGKKRHAPLVRLRKEFIAGAIRDGARNSDAARFLGCSTAYVSQVLDQEGC